jgi:ABC-2 type transport system permease protein
MAGLNPDLGAQLRAIGILRWRLFVNSLRSIRGRMNLVSRSLAALVVLAAAVGGALTLGAVAWGMTNEHQLRWLSVPFWLIFLFWQVFPVMATAFTQNIDASNLLRFPLSYPGYFLVRLIYGTLDIATALGVSWCLGLLIGISAADLRLAPWTALAVGSFVLFNLALARMIFVWIEHWLSSRRSREIMGVLFLVMMIGFQVAGPVLGRYSRWPAAQRLAVLEKFLPLERSLPPGLTAAVVAESTAHGNSSALVSLAWLGGYIAIALGILHMRLRGQYRGENPSQGEKPRVAPGIRNGGAIRHSWRLPLLSGPVSAVYEKELHYFSRSGPMLFTLIMPVIMVFVLWGGRRALMGQQMNFVFPIGAAYCLMVMTNIVYNSFGGEGGGIQFFLYSPISFRQITAAKNLAQLTILAIDVAILWMGIRLVFRPPRLRVIALTLAWLFFATPLNFAVGNLLSIYSPKRIDYAVFGRQRAAETTILLSLAVQLSLLGIGALALLIGRYYHNLWTATAALSALAVPSLAGYFVLLSRVDRIAVARRDVMTAELCRA